MTKLTYFLEACSVSQLNLKWIFGEERVILKNVTGAYIYSGNYVLALSADNTFPYLLILNVAKKNKDVWF